MSHAARSGSALTRRLLSVLVLVAPGCVLVDPPAGVRPDEVEGGAGFGGVAGGSVVDGRLGGAPGAGGTLADGDAGSDADAGEGDGGEGGSAGGDEGYSGQTGTGGTKGDSGAGGAAGGMAGGGGKGDGGGKGGVGGTGGTLGGGGTAGSTVGVGGNGGSGGNGGVGGTGTGGTVSVGGSAGSTVAGGGVGGLPSAECTVGEFKCAANGLGMVCGSLGTWISNGSIAPCNCTASGRFRRVSSGLVRDTTTNLIWDASVRPSADWATASGACDDAGMRLPTLSEMKRILLLYPSAANCSIDSIPFDQAAMPTFAADMGPKYSNPVRYGFWTSTPIQFQISMYVLWLFPPEDPRFYWVSYDGEDRVTYVYAYRCVKG